MSATTKHKLGTTVALVGFVLVAIFAGVVVANGIDLARYIPILSMVFVGGVALALVTRQRYENTQSHHYPSQDTGLQR